MNATIHMDTKYVLKKKTKYIACARYSLRMCDDNKNFKKISDYQYVRNCLRFIKKNTFSVNLFLLSKDINLKKTI